MLEVRVGDVLAERIASAYGPRRTGSGSPSEWDFWSGPLQAALIGFRDFDNLRFEEFPEVRTLHLVDPIFGAVVFVGVLLPDGIVELADFDIDPEYWNAVEEDPDD